MNVLTNHELIRTKGGCLNVVQFYKTVKLIVKSILRNVKLIAR